LPPPLLLLLVPALLSGAAEHAEVLCAGTACYTLHRGKLSWGNAQKKCQDDGGNLAAIRSAQEARHVQELLGRSPAGAGWQGNVWIGLSLEKGKCMQAHDPLRGFSWAGGSGEASNYSAWLAEPLTTCVSHRCGSLQPAGPSSAGGWADRPCKLPLPGYVCKFSFQGMCGPLALAGPGTVSYRTPFGAESPALSAAPFGTLAQVACEAGGQQPHFVLCKERRAAGGFAWHQRGPLCATSCSHRNGGCAQQCLEAEAGAPLRCACRPGFVLGPDLVSCVADNVCEPNPCEGTCRPGADGGAECSCLPGFTLAPDGQRCLDVDECLGQPCRPECRSGAASPHCDASGCAAGAAACPQLCINVPGSFRCACAPGFTTAPDGTTCLPEPPATNGTVGTAPGTLTEQPLGSSAQPTTTSTPTSTSTSSSIASSTISATTSSTTSSSARATSATSISTSTSTASTSTSMGPRSALDAEHAADGPKLLLYYILGSLVAILLLMAFALALLAYRRRKAKEEKRQAKSAADDYCWVPEQAEGGGASSGFR
ncbi:C1QR1 protein, partial [Nothoprocta ornata]|nr:C1QR1 protein [Nothoprocta ornata]